MNLVLLSESSSHLGDLCVFRYQGIITMMGPLTLTRATGELVNKLSGHQGSLTLTRYLPYP